MPRLVSSGYSGTFSLSILIQIHLIFAQSCYFPDGTNAPDHIPCNGSVSVSHCCEPGDTCLTTSLCYQASNMSINTGTCTDKSWKNPSCFQQCPASAVFQNSTVNTLFRCDSDYWCCTAGANNTSCCGDPASAYFYVGTITPAAIYNGSGFASGYTVAPIQALNTQSSVLTQTSVFTQLSVLTPSCTAINQPNSIDGPLSSAPAFRNCTSSNNPTTTGIGAGLGVAIPLLIALGSIAFLLLRERQKSKSLTQIINEGHQSRDQRPHNGMSASKEGQAGAAELQGIGMQRGAQYH